MKVDNENFGDSNEKISSILDYLNELKQPEKIVNDPKAHVDILFLYEVTQIRKFFDLIDWELFSNRHFYEIISEVLYYLNENYKNSKSGSTPTENDSLLLLYYSVKIINAIVSKSLSFCSKFNETRGLSAFFLMLKNRELQLKMEPNDLAKPIVANLNWLSRVSEDSLINWVRINAYQVLLDRLKTDRNSIALCQTIINISTDSELEQLPEECIKLHLYLLERCEVDFNKNQFNRELKEFMNDDRTISKFKVHLIHIEEQQYLTLTSILLVFYRLSINESTKLDLYFNYNIMKILNVILGKGQLIEQKYVLKLIAQLTFNKKITEDFIKNYDFTEFIQCEQKDDGFLKEIVNQIKWNLKIACEKTKVKEDLNKDNQLNSDAILLNANNQNEQKHIMISYNTAQRDICLKIKNSLELIGFKIWIDVKDISGSSLDSMAQAVEQSSCVLICVSEKYRQSVNCQAEALYAFRLNKKIVPLIMQKGYENVQGWLGIIIGDKKYDFDECMRRLKKELDFKSSSPFETKIELEPITHPVSLANKSKQIFDSCSSEQVKKWFLKYNLNMTIYERLSPDFNGELLRQLYDMKCNAPEFYFKSLEKILNNDESLKSILNFTIHLTRLFS